MCDEAEAAENSALLSGDGKDDNPVRYESQQVFEAFLKEVFEACKGFAALFRVI